MRTIALEDSTRYDATSCAGSVFGVGLGPRFVQLDPHTRWRFGIRATDDRAQVGIGTMRTMRAAVRARPLLRWWNRHGIGISDSGVDVPFSIVNVGFVDELGREGITVSRRFHFPSGTQSFDATMLRHDEAGTVMDLLGSDQSVAAVLDLSVDPVTRGIRLRGRSLHLLGRSGRRVRLPLLLAGRASVHEWWDDAAGCFRIEVVVRHRLLGEVMRYEGSFSVTSTRRSHPLVADALPRTVRPIGRQS